MVMNEIRLRPFCYFTILRSKYIFQCYTRMLNFPFSWDQYVNNSIIVLSFQELYLWFEISLWVVSCFFSENVPCGLIFILQIYLPFLLLSFLLWPLFLSSLSFLFLLVFIALLLLYSHFHWRYWPVLDLLFILNDALSCTIIRLLFRSLAFLLSDCFDFFTLPVLFSLLITAHNNYE